MQGGHGAQQAFIQVKVTNFYYTDGGGLQEAPPDTLGSVSLRSRILTE